MQGNPCTLRIDIGCRFPLFLDKKILDGLKKQPKGTQICRNIYGNQEEALHYLIPQLKLGDLVLKNATAYQTDEERHNSLGMFLGSQFNLLLDFTQDRIIACDSFSKLCNKKIADKTWIQLPFEMHRSGIALYADTDFGTRKLVLSTACANSLFNSCTFAANDELAPYVSSSFALGGHQFPNVTFEYFALPEDLKDIDGIIGMDYLKEHAIYLDYTNKTAYIAPPQRYFERIPVTFSKRNDPLIEVSVEHAMYPLLLDLGTPIWFSLKSEVLQKIDKTLYGTSKWYDFRGISYESTTYTIPEIKIGSLKFFHVFVKQDREDFYANTTLIGDPLQFAGAMGLSILKKYNLSLDFPNSVIYASKDLLLLQESGLFSYNFLAVAFTTHPDGIILPVETDTGVYRLLLDTGATTTTIRPPHPSFTSKFSIMGHNFGQRCILPVEISSQFDFDGCLGMDFLQEYRIFIDYSNKVVFIDLEKDGPKSSVI